MSKDLESSQSDGSPIGEELMLFIRQIDSLHYTLSPLLFFIQKINEFNNKKIDDYEIRYGKIQDIDDKEGKIIEMPLELSQEYEKMLSKGEKYYYARRLIPRSFVISLISQYDAFIGRLVRVLSTVLSDNLGIAEKQISFSQLQNFGSIEDAKEFLIEREIDLLLRKSHSEQFEWLESKYHVELRKDLKIWPTFIEATERRNLFVHTDGIISNQYLNICKQHNVKLEDNVQMGRRLEVSASYFTSIYNCIFELGVGIAHVLWRKLVPSDREYADTHLNRVAYELLVEEKFGLACTILDFAIEIIKKHSTDFNKRQFIINRSQAYKWVNDFEKAKKILESMDWTASQDSFKLARAVILDDFDTADHLVRKIGANGEVTKSDYRDWPLFREYRKSESFQQIFQQIFSESLYPEHIEIAKSEYASEDSDDLTNVLVATDNP